MKKNKNFRKRNIAEEEEDHTEVTEDSNDMRFALEENQEIKCLQKPTEMKLGVPAVVKTGQAAAVSGGCNAGGLVTKGEDKGEGEGENDDLVLHDTFADERLNDAEPSKRTKTSESNETSTGASGTRCNIEEGVEEESPEEPQRPNRRNKDEDNKVDVFLDKFNQFDVIQMKKIRLKMKAFKVMTTNINHLTGEEFEVASMMKNKIAKIYSSEELSMEEEAQRPNGRDKDEDNKVDILLDEFNLHMEEIQLKREAFKIMATNIDHLKGKYFEVALMMKNKFAKRYGFEEVSREEAQHPTRRNKDKDNKE